MRPWIRFTAVALAGAGLTFSTMPDGGEDVSTQGLATIANQVLQRT